MCVWLISGCWQADGLTRVLRQRPLYIDRRSSWPPDARPGLLLAALVGDMRACRCPASAKNQRISTDFCPLPSSVADHWSWNEKEKSAEVNLYGDGLRTVLFHPGWSNGTAAVKANKVLNGTVTYWEIEVSHRVFGTSLTFGFGTNKANLYEMYFTNILGQDDQSWGFSHKGLLWHNGLATPYTEPFQENVPTVIGVLFDGISGTVKFYKDGRDLGVAFTGMDKIQEPLYPMVGSTAARTEMTLGTRRRACFSLMERCLFTIGRQLESIEEVEMLPLPQNLKRPLVDEVRGYGK